MRQACPLLMLERVQALGAWYVLASLALTLVTGACSRSAAPSPPSYAHITVKLLHGDQPITMDWIVACRAFQRGGEMRAYTRVTVAPYVYGIATPDGGMVLAVAPDYCGHGTPPKDYLPLLMWGDKAGDFSFLTAYVTEDAFGNPASKLKVVDVTMRPSDQADLDAWRKAGAKNIVPVQHNPFLRNADGKTREHRVACSGFYQIPVLPSMQAVVDAAWPPDHPLYWVPQGDKAVNAIFAGVPDTFYHLTKLDLQYESERLSSGEGAVRNATNSVTIVDTATARQSKIVDPIPIDFDFFRKDISVYDILQQHFKRPLIADGRVDAENRGMMYCGFFPDLMGAVDSDYTFHFPDGQVRSIGHRDVMMNTTKLLLFSGLGMDIERGEDGDE